MASHVTEHLIGEMPQVTTDRHGGEAAAKAGNGQPGRRRRPAGKAPVRSLRALVASLAVVGGVAGFASAAHAAGPDVNGGRISWDSHIPCSDGGSVYVSAHGSYNAPYGGRYALRYVLERSDNSVLGANPWRYWTIGGAYDALRFNNWYEWFSYRGEAHAVAYVYRQTSSGAWALMARETIPCI